MEENKVPRKLESVKTLNTSEARAHFAEILSEKDKVLITRHGYPLKILIDYREYLQLLQFENSKENPTDSLI